MSNQLISEKVEALKKQLANAKWLHEHYITSAKEPNISFYRDVAELNTERKRLDLLGKETLKSPISELLKLLDTSVAIYEKNGDYAYCTFKSCCITKNDFDQYYDY